MGGVSEVNCKLIGPRLNSNNGRDIYENKLNQYNNFGNKFEKKDGNLKLIRNDPMYYSRYYTEGNSSTVLSPSDFFLTKDGGMTGGDSENLSFESPDWSEDVKNEKVEIVWSPSEVSDRMDTTTIASDVSEGNISQKLEHILSNNVPHGVQSLKRKMKASMFQEQLAEDNLLREMDRYKDTKRKILDAIKMQKYLLHKKNKRKVTANMKTSYRKLSSNTEPQTINKLNLPEKKLEKESVTIDRDERSPTSYISSASISCPSETDSDNKADCECTEKCQCNELARYRKYMLEKEKVEERLRSQKKLRKEKKCGFDDFYKRECRDCLVGDMDSGTSTSSSDCSIVRRCHCAKACCCGCDDYRDYLKYKLYQVKSRKKKRDEKRSGRWIREYVIKGNYEEDEYDRKVKDFIKQNFVDPDRKDVLKGRCNCGSVQCDCNEETSEKSDDKEEKENSSVKEENYIEETESSEEKPGSPNSILQCNAGDLFETNEFQFESKSAEFVTNILLSTEPGGCQQLSDLLFRSGALWDICSRKVLEKGKKTDDKDCKQSKGCNKCPHNSCCNCKQWFVFGRYLKALRRAQEKENPLLKYFRKRWKYLNNKAEAEILLGKTSSDSDEPIAASASLSKRCGKYESKKFLAQKREKLIKKKNRTAEKKLLLEIMKGAGHQYPCKCMGSDEDLSCHCQPCGSDNRKIKIEPAINLRDVQEEYLVYGSQKMYPNCPQCPSLAPDSDNKTLHYSESERKESETKDIENEGSEGETLGSGSALGYTVRNKDISRQEKVQSMSPGNENGTSVEEEHYDLNSSEEKMRSSKRKSGKKAHKNFKTDSKGGLKHSDKVGIKSKHQRMKSKEGKRKLSKKHKRKSKSIEKNAGKMKLHTGQQKTGVEKIHKKQS